MESVRHPNVVGIRGAVDGNEPALAMDFVDGRSVAEMGADGHTFTESEALGIAAGVAEGLAAAHERGIVHRDVKPANVLIDHDGVARLSDFGIAVVPDDATALTADDGVIGTLRYLAPERLAGEPATPATDVWGVGTVLYELLTGTPAFPAATLTERVEMASRPADRPEGIADATWAVVSRCLESDPGDRFADGAVLSAALHLLPGVPAPAVLSTDPGAVTEVIPLRAEVAAGSPAIAGPVESEAGLLSDALGQRTRSRAAWVGGTVAVLVIAAAAASAITNDPVDDPGASITMASPQATTTIATPAPTADATPVETASGEKPGKGKDKGKGRGN